MHLILLKLVVKSVVVLHHQPHFCRIKYSFITIFSRKPASWLDLNVSKESDLRSWLCPCCIVELQPSAVIPLRVSPAGRSWGAAPDCHPPHIQRWRRHPSSPRISHLHNHNNSPADWEILSFYAGMSSHTISAPGIGHTSPVPASASKSSEGS